MDAITKWYIREVLNINLDVPPAISPIKMEKKDLATSKIIKGLIDSENTAVKQYTEALKIDDLKEHKEPINHILKEEKEHIKILNNILNKL